MYASVLTKLGIHSLLSGGGSIIFFPMRSVIDIRMFNKTIPLWSFCAGIGALTSLITDGIHLVLQKEIHLSKKAEDEASLILGAGSSALILYSVMNALDYEIGSTFGMYNAFILGAGAEIGSVLLSNMILNQ